MTSAESLPSFYIPHGGGPAFFMDGPMGEAHRELGNYLATIGDALPIRPEAILIVTAHWEAALPTLTGGEAPGLIYDYYGFPPHTYELTYPAPGNPKLAERAAGLLDGAGIANAVDPAYGWDHGVFIPLKVMFPEAEIPVVALSLQVGLDPTAHIEMGRALAPLRNEGVLIVGSGLSYHNMQGFGSDNGSDSAQFDAWLDQALTGDQAHRANHLARWAAAPAGRSAHPREEHLLPLMVAAGAGSDRPGHKTWEGDFVTARVSAWAFN